MWYIIITRKVETLMSEFTSGNLIQSKYRDVIEKYRVDGIKISDLNSEWTVFLTEDVYIEDQVPIYIINISKEIPIMYFFNYEDHGWGYRIFHNGEEVAKLVIDYEIEYNLVLEKAKEKYVDEGDIIEILYFGDRGEEVYNEIAEEVVNSNEYYNVVQKQFLYKTVEKFKLFNINDGDINELRELLTVDSYTKTEQLHKLVEKFKKIVNINEMEWINYDFTDNLKIKSK